MPDSKKLVWDQDGERYYDIGVDKPVLFVMKDDGTYDKGVAWNGLTNVTENPSGGDVNDYVSVTVSDPLCKRYCARAAKPFRQP